MTVERILLVGVSRAGTHVAAAFARGGRAAIVGSVSRRTDPRIVPVLRDLPRLDAENWTSAAPTILLIAVADDAITEVAGRLARAPAAATGAERVIAVHLSGSLSEAALAPLSAIGMAAASTHPVRSFPDFAETADGLDGAFVGVECADSAARARLESLLLGAGARAFRVRGDEKARYHLGAVFASNVLTALFDASLGHYTAAGVPEAIATEILADLASGTIANIRRIGTERALTGPAVRGDLDVIRRHRAALKDPADIAIFVLAVRAVLSLARRAHPERAAAYDAIDRFIGESA